MTSISNGLTVIVERIRYRDEVKSITDHYVLSFC